MVLCVFFYSCRMSKKKDTEILPSQNKRIDKKILEDIVVETTSDKEGDHKTLVPAQEKLPSKPTDSTDPLTLYIREISRYPLLSLEQENALIQKLEESGDIEVAKKLVLHNLRLVVKIAMEFRNSYQNVMDLIQEGNIGLMKAVSKYDSTKGAKLSYYSSWWIRSYILKFILDNFHLVKIGTTNDQKKLFYNLIRERNKLMAMGINPNPKLLAENLGVTEKSVKLMDSRLGPHGGEVSIDAPSKATEGATRFSDTLTDSDQPEIDELLAHNEGLDLLKTHLHGFLANLKPRDKEIFKKRLLSETPSSLQSIADEYGVSRERIRQIEVRLIENLKVYMSDIIK